MNRDLIPMAQVTFSLLTLSFPTRRGGFLTFSLSVYPHLNSPLI